MYIACLLAYLLTYFPAEAELPDDEGVVFWDVALMKEDGAPAYGLELRQLELCTRSLPLCAPDERYIYARLSASPCVCIFI